MSLIDEFLKTVNEQKASVAIVSKKHNKTFQDLFVDVNKLITKFLKLNISKKSKILLLVNMSYEMYVGIFACCLYGLDVVIIDNFKDKKRVNQQLIDVDVDYVLTNNITSLVKNIFRPLQKVKSINVIKTLKEIKETKNFEYSTDAKLITFTSGGTGNPKPVQRSLDDLEKQLKLTINVVGNLQNEYVLATLPIYTLACLIEGIKVYIPSKKENLNDVIKKEQPTVMFSSISKYLTIDDAPSLKKAYFGGSILYYQEALKIRRSLPNAKVTYIYGATEASIISTTTLDDYIKSLNNNELCLGDILPNNQITINEEEIIVSKGIITNNYLNQENKEFHPTKDLGYVKDNKIYLTGRKITDQIKSNYLLEMLVKKAFSEIFPIAILVIENQYHIYLEEFDASKRLDVIAILENYIQNGVIHIIKKLPLDYRHQAKIDYKKLLKIDNGDKYVQY